MNILPSSPYEKQSDEPCPSIPRENNSQIQKKHMPIFFFMDV